MEGRMNSNRVKYLIKTFFHNSKLNREKFVINKTNYQLLQGKNKKNAFQIIQKRQLTTMRPQRPHHPQWRYLLFAALGVSLVRVIQD
jgi:hypothetical protein